MAKRPAPRRKHGLEGGRDIVNRKGDVSKAGAICGGRWPLSHAIVLEDFEGWSVIAVPGQSQMNPLKTGTRDAGGEGEPISFKVSHRWNRCTAKNLLVEKSQSSPVLSDEIRVYEPGTQWQVSQTSLRNAELKLAPAVGKLPIALPHPGPDPAILLEKAADSK